MIVRMWMTANPAMLQVDRPIIEAARLMTANRVRRLPIVDKHPLRPRLVGIVSANDIIRACGPDLNLFAARVEESIRTAIPIQEVMTENPITTTAEAPIEEAALVMDSRKIGCLPVIRDHALIGLITESDIFRAFVSLFATVAEGVRITFDVSEGEDVFSFVSEATRRRGLQVTSLISSVQEDRPVCVVRITGSAVEELLEELWTSGHRVLNVLRFH